MAAPLPRVARLSKLIGATGGAPSSREVLHAGAQIYINFLSLTRRSGWLQAHISKLADLDAEKAKAARQALEASASRYVDFMELRQERRRAVPTRDISIVWSSDLLRPTLGSILEHAEQKEHATAWFEHQQHRLLQSGARTLYLPSSKLHPCGIYCRELPCAARCHPNSVRTLSVG